MIKHLFEKISIEGKDGIVKEGLALRDGQGFILDRKKALEIIAKLDLFYNTKSVDEWIKDKNLETYFWQYEFKYDEEKDVYLLKKPSYELRKPKLRTAKSWSFTCAWCGNKWSSKDKEYYYRAYFEVNGFKSNGETVCSEACAKHISLDIQKEWIHKRGFDKFFKKE